MKNLKGNAGKEYAKEHFEQLKVDDVLWQVLHVDRDTGQYWKEYFPNSGEHGGGSPVFIKITEEQAKKEFGI